jgi:signal transduction histidine kinase
LIIAAGVVISIIFIAAAAISIDLIRKNTKAEWSNQLESLTLILSEHASQTLFSGVTTLNSIYDLVENARLTDERSFIEFSQKEAQYKILVEKTSGNSIINVASLVSSKGKVLNFSRSFPPPSIDLSDREYFKWLSTHNSPNIFYSEPVKNKGDGRWVFYLSRRINNNKGEFLGVLLVGVSSEVFSKFYEKIGTNLGKSASLTLYRSDYTLMTRWPFEESLIGIKNDTSATKSIIADLKLPHGILITDSPRLTTGSKSERRMVAARTVENYPFIATAVIQEDLYTPSWIKGLVWIWASLIFGLTLIGVSVWQLINANKKIGLELTERIAAQNDLTRAHERLESRVAERTADLSREISERKLAQEELARLNTHIADVSHRAGMAEVANSVIHNVGNALNSINVAITTINADIKNTPLNTLPKIADMLETNINDLYEFLKTDEKGRQLPKLISMLSRQWKLEYDHLLAESGKLQESVAHIREIVSRQQSFSGRLGIDEIINIPDLINNCLSFYVTNFKNAKIHISINNKPGLEWTGDRSKITQILINLIMNAEESLLASNKQTRILDISSSKDPNGGIQIEVSDNGSGIEPEVLTKLFGYGFTTKPFGHGLGLHASAIAANEMNGTLQAFSPGKDKGATFILKLPKRLSPYNT